MYNILSFFDVVHSDEGVVEEWKRMRSESCICQDHLDQISSCPAHRRQSVRVHCQKQFQLNVFFLSDCLSFYFPNPSQSLRIIDHPKYFSIELHTNGEGE